MFSTTGIEATVALKFEKYQLLNERLTPKFNLPSKFELDDGVRVWSRGQESVPYVYENGQVRLVADPNSVAAANRACELEQRDESNWYPWLFTGRIALY